MPTNLVSSGLATRSLTLFAVGGSGIRTLEPLLHLCALGLGPRQLRVVLVDPDQSNAAVAQSRRLMDLYTKARQALLAGRRGEDGYFRTEVTDAIGNTPLWSPISDEEHLPNAVFGARIDRPRMAGPSAGLGQVADLLYPPILQKMDLTLGFRGVPSIGTVFMHRLKDQAFFEQLLVNAQTDADGVYFTIGSVFGGTGAAGLPVIGRALVGGISGEGQRNDVRGVERRRVGAALFLPYFTLPAPKSSDAADGGIRPEASLFAQNAAAALPTYVTGQAGYGGIYAIGDEQPREQERNEVGGAAQANRAHYVELYAALAALDFAARGGERPEDAARLPVFRMAGVDASNVRWSDLPIDDASRTRLLGGMLAVHTFLNVFRPDGERHPDLAHVLGGVTWARTIGLDAAALDRNAGAYDLLGQFFRRTWDWLGELRASNPALELLRSGSDAPTRVSLHQSVEHRRSTSTIRPTTRGGNEVFRWWNVAAAQAGKEAGLLDVMQRGSEMYAEQF